MNARLAGLLYLVVAICGGFAELFARSTVKAADDVAEALRDSADLMAVAFAADLAERIGVTRQTVIAIEQGRYSPSLEMAFQIARVFDVPLDDVFQYPG